MTNKDFTEQFAKIDRTQTGFTGKIAASCSASGKYDDFVEMLVDQYIDPGSRPMVERMCGEELTEFIKQQSSKRMNEDTNK